MKHLKIGVLFSSFLSFGFVDCSQSPPGDHECKLHCKAVHCSIDYKASHPPRMSYVTYDASVRNDGPTGVAHVDPRSMCQRQCPEGSPIDACPSECYEFFNCKEANVDNCEKLCYASSNYSVPDLSFATAKDATVVSSTTSDAGVVDASIQDMSVSDVAIVDTGAHSNFQQCSDNCWSGFCQTDRNKFACRNDIPGYLQCVNDCISVYNIQNQKSICVSRCTDDIDTCLTNC